MFYYCKISPVTISNAWDDYEKERGGEEGSGGREGRDGNRYAIMLSGVHKRLRLVDIPSGK